MGNRNRQAGAEFRFRAWDSRHCHPWAADESTLGEVQTEQGELETA
jgi:hypothetical protein